MYYRMYKDARQEWRWTLRAANHEPIAVSSESYKNKEDCRHSITLVKQSVDAPIMET